MSYRDIKSYQQATIIYDITVEFCKQYISPTSRTADQMTQAARSGKQNIAEGASERTSKKSELYLTGIARASLQELLEDYEDYVRQHGLRLWAKDSPQAQVIRRLSYQPDRSYKTYESYMSNPETASNVAVCLIHQTNFLLDRQIKALEAQFVKEGGYTEKLHRQRNEEKKRRLIDGFWRKFE